MKNILLFILPILSACSLLTKTVTVAIPPVHDTAWMVKHDTVLGPPIIQYVTKDSIQIVSVPVRDTIGYLVLTDTAHVIRLKPSASGDSYLELQTAINYYQTHPGFKEIQCSGGTFSYSKPPISYVRKGADYGQACVNITGIVNAKTAPAAFCTTFAPAYTNAPAFSIQKGKSCLIKNIIFSGRYFVPPGLTSAQIDTLKFKDWEDGICTFGRTNPYCGIAIDPISNRGVYGTFDGNTYERYAPFDSLYLPGTDRSGSTDIRIENCQFTGFPVAIALTPSNQQNCEEIVIADCNIVNCRSGIAFTQSQQRENHVYGLQCWGGVHTLFDGGNYGYVHGDGSCAPMIDHVNVAGNVFQLIYAASNASPIGLENVYAERLFRIGIAGGPMGTSFKNCQFDLQCASDDPSPDFVYWGPYTTWENCAIRHYNGTNQRWIMNSVNNLFIGGAFSAPPVLSPLQIINGANNRPMIVNVGVFTTGDVLNMRGYDSVGSATVVTLHVLPGFTASYKGTGNEVTGDIILTQKHFYDQLSNNQGIVQLGYVSAVASDGTVSIINLGVGMHDGDQMTVWPSVLKK